jgi:DNA polymerase III epsilon subunit-like protein
MLILDIEASGLEYDKHSIVSLGALDLDNPSYRFYMECRVWDGAHISDEALGVNGFTREQITDTTKEPESELAIRFLEWSEMIGDRTLGGQNPSFDRDMLKAAIHRAHQNWTLAHRTVDSHTLCWMHMVKRGIPVPLDPQHKRSALNLDAVLVYCGIPEEPHPHNALTGAMCHAEVISRLLNDKKLLPEFNQYEIPWKQ